MANEIINVENGTIINAPKPNYNKNLGETFLAITIKCKKVKTSKGIIFNSVKVLKYMEVIADGVSEGKKMRWLDGHFTTKAFTSDCCVHQPADLTTGTLYVKAKGIQSPRVYEVKEDIDENGNVIYNEDGTAKLKYPDVWFKDDSIVGFEAYVSSQDEFDYHEAPISYKPATGEIDDDVDSDDEVDL